MSRTVYSNPKSPNGYVNLAKFCIENRHPNAAIAVLKEMESQSKPTPESNAIKQRALEMIGGSQSKDANQRAPMTIFELMETGNG